MKFLSSIIVALFIGAIFFCSISLADTPQTVPVPVLQGVSPLAPNTPSKLLPPRKFTESRFFLGGGRDNGGDKTQASGPARMPSYTLNSGPAPAIGH